MAAEAEHATGSREQESCAPRPPRIPASKVSLAHTFTLERRRGVAWPAPTLAELSDGSEELLDRIYRLKAVMQAAGQGAFEAMERAAPGKANQTAAEALYLIVEGSLDQIDAIHLLANAINERAALADLVAGAAA